MPLDINDFREEKGADLKKLYESQAARNKPREEIDRVIQLDKDWRQALFDVEQLKKAYSKSSKEIGQKRKAGEDTTALQEANVKAKAEIEAKEKACNEIKATLDAALNNIGNFVDPSVPREVDEDKNAVVTTWGDTKQTGKERHHHELLYMIDGYEPERGSAIAGHRGYFLKGPGVLLNQALINYGLAFLMKHNYTPLQPPFFMRKEVMAETAQLEDFDEQLYKVTGEGKDEMYLIATSEQPISAYHRGEVLSEGLPFRYAGISSCFRKEAGKHGKDAWGIFRVHQFEKVEQFCITDPESSEAMHEEMITIAQDFYKSLGISYRVVNIVSGALNNAAAKKYDLEGWFPTLGLYRELVSASNCTDYQSRAMETKFGHSKQKEGMKEKKYVHMLNATLTATERTICCILENYQTEEGVRVPEVLVPFCGGITFFPFKREMPKNVTKEKQEKAKEKGGAKKGGAKKDDAKASE